MKIFNLNCFHACKIDPCFLSAVIVPKIFKLKKLTSFETYFVEAPDHLDRSK